MRIQFASNHRNLEADPSTNGVDGMPTSFPLFGRCKQSNTFFNVLFNLTKFIQGDQKDPAQIFHERSTPELTDWDRYAKMEYSR